MVFGETLQRPLLRCVHIHLVQLQLDWHGERVEEAEEEEDENGVRSVTRHKCHPLPISGAKLTFTVHVSRELMDPEIFLGFAKLAQPGPGMKIFFSFTRPNGPIPNQ